MYHICHRSFLRMRRLNLEARIKGLKNRVYVLCGLLIELPQSYDCTYLELKFAKLFNFGCNLENFTTF